MATSPRRPALPTWVTSGPMTARIESFTGSSARRLSSWMKARLVTTNRKTRKSVWRVFSVVKCQPRGGGGVSVFPGGAPRERRDNQRYHAGYPLSPFGAACPGALPRAADLRATGQRPLVEVQGLGDAAG